MLALLVIDEGWETVRTWNNQIHIHRWLCVSIILPCNLKYAGISRVSSPWSSQCFLNSTNIITVSTTLSHFLNAPLPSLRACHTMLMIEGCHCSGRKHFNLQNLNNHNYQRLGKTIFSFFLIFDHHICENSHHQYANTYDLPTRF